MQNAESCGLGMTSAVEELDRAPKRKVQNRSSEELEMRNLVVPELRKRWPAARIIHELPLRYSTNRIDLAAVTETEIISVEIKSSKDVIDRLEAQLRAFVPISARMIVALAPKWNIELPMLEKKGPGWTSYAPQYTEAQEVIRRVSEGIEVWTADVATNSLTKTSGGYYRANRPWLSRMMHMLHVNELVEIAGEHKICLPKRRSHEVILESCCELMTGREIIKSVCRALRERDAFDKASDLPILPAVSRTPPQAMPETLL